MGPGDHNRRAQYVRLGVNAFYAHLCNRRGAPVVS
jgi:hypothetical protein